MIQEGLKTSNYREITKWDEVIQGGIDAELLIVGSSRALVHFDCEYIQKVTGKTCYNLGFDGTTFPLQKLMLELYLSQNKAPKEIIWSIDYHMFSRAPDYYGFEQLIPYQSNPFIRIMLSMHETPGYQLEIPIFRYSYNPKMKVIGLYSFFGKYESESVLKNGFRKQNKFWDGSFEEFKSNRKEVVFLNFEKKLFEEFLRLNQELLNNGSISWVISPYFFEYNAMIKNRSHLLKKFDSSANHLQIPLIDFSQHEISYEKYNFYNSSHLSKKGVESFLEKWMEYF
ncbi:MAG: hypothetical protein HWE07_09420 [Cytophagia bacterium]|nr:hypothetical protein [Cytophagia bacterium]